VEKETRAGLRIIRSAIAVATHYLHRILHFENLISLYIMVANIKVGPMVYKEALDDFTLK
jgi:hypothetical protein